MILLLPHQRFRQQLLSLLQSSLPSTSGLQRSGSRRQTTTNRSTSFITTLWRFVVYINTVPLLASGGHRRQFVTLTSAFTVSTTTTIQQQRRHIPFVDQPRASTLRNNNNSIIITTTPGTASYMASTTGRRASASKSEGSNNSMDEENEIDGKRSKPPKSSRSNSKNKSKVNGETTAGSTTARATTATKKRKKETDNEGVDVTNTSDDEGAGTMQPKTTTNSPKKKKAADHQRITEIDKIPKLWNDELAKANGSYTYKIASWNVAGLRALVKKSPTALSDLVKKYDLDMLCLQEHKLQDVHLDDPKLKLKGLLDEEGYDEYYAFSTAKKGYSGTAVFIRRSSGSGKPKKQQKQLTSFFAPKQQDDKKSDVSGENKDEARCGVSTSAVKTDVLVPLSVSYNIGKPIDNEGRTVIVEMPFATLVNVYVPNSGQTLERLDYRTKEWDKFFLEFMITKQKERKLPVIWLGDLNIAHRALDIWNDGASHLDKQAGVTPQERVSFTEQLESGFVDAFRRLHPDAKGHYSYWSQRAGNRTPNKGLRLDYFICSEDLFEETSNVVVRDSYMAMEQAGSDHGPVILELEIKK